MISGVSVSRSQEQEWNENQVPEGEEDVFVLTDEWMEFFAKSEAKRKLGKFIRVIIIIYVIEYSCHFT